MQNVIELLRSRGIEARKVSSTNGGEDRFRIWPEENSGQGAYWCRQCEKKVDQIQFLIAIDYDDHPGAWAAAWWAENFSQAEIWPPPRGKDPGEAYQKGVNIRDWIIAGLPAWSLGRFDTEKKKEGGKDALIKSIDEPALFRSWVQKMLR